MADLSLVFDLLAKDRASSEVKKVGDSMKDAGDDADQFGERMSGMFAGIAGLAAGAGLAVGASFMSALESESANRITTAQLGLDPAESAAAGRVAGELFAGNYGDSMSHASEAVGAVMSSISGMRTASEADLQAATTNALNFAQAFDVDVSEAAALAGSVIQNGFAGNATEAFDLVTAGMQQIPAAMRGELAPILTEYGTNFRALGYSGEQAMALLVDAAAQGPFVLDKMGDALKELTINAIDLGKNGPIYERIGLDAQGMAAAIATGGPAAQEATQQIAAGLLGIEDPVERANAAVSMFGAPLEDLSIDQIPQFLSAIGMANGELEGVAGTAAELDTTLSTGIGPTLETIKRQAQQAASEGFTALLNGFTQGKTEAAGWQGGLQNAAATVSGVLTPALSGLGTFLTGTVGPALGAVFGLLSEHQTTVAVIAGIIAAVLTPAVIAWGIAALVTGGQNVVAWLTSTVAASAGAIAQGISFAGVVAGWVLMGVQSLLQAARMAAAWLIAMGPVGWVIAAVIALVALIVANWDTIVAATSAAWKWVSDKIGGAWDWIVGKVTGAATAVWTLIQNAWEIAKSKTMNAFEGIKTAVSNGIDAAVSFVKELPGRIMSGLGNLATLLVSAGGDLLRGLQNGIKNAVSGVVQAAKDAAKAAVDGVKSFLGIASPSRVMRGIGVNMGQGLALGIADMRPGVAAELAKLADAQAVPLIAQMGGTTRGAGLGYRPPGYDAGGATAGAGGSVTNVNTTINAAPTIPTEDQLAGVYRRASLLAPRRG